MAIGRQVGLLTGLAESGCDLSGADLVVGTSAGALVGAFLARGADLSGALRSLARMAQAMSADQLAEGSQVLLAAMAQAGQGPEALRSIGRLAVQHHTLLDEASFLGLVTDLVGLAWPTTFRCTATAIDTGEVVVWTADSAVELHPAVAAGCAAPVLFAPVTIGGRRYLDGGVLSHVNARAAADAERMVVPSCFPLDQPPAAFQTVQQEIAELRAADVALLTVEPSPEVFTLGAGGPAMMNPALAEQAYTLGRAQAGIERGRTAA
ncbi:patatin-like phospholipase family protein [Streptomyces sp. NPDC047082]|uniref:patatin-like phospholipase family protein n=1 Tax=Streptomyces sp. NPDC047082 TaxID=3155259 RepID=UPI0033F69328